MQNCKQNRGRESGSAFLFCAEGKCCAAGAKGRFDFQLPPFDWRAFEVDWLPGD